MMSPPQAHTWRAFGALAIWVGVLLAGWLLLIGMMSTIGNFGSYDCGSACEERIEAAHARRQTLTTVALIGGGLLVAAGVLIRVRVPNPDA